MKTFNSISIFEIQKESGKNSIDWTVVDQVCSSYTVTDLDEPSYYFEVRTVNDKKESVGATSDIVDIFTLDGVSEPRFELYEDETGWVLKASDLSTSTSVFHSVEWAITDTRATVCEGEYVASAEELAAIAQNKSTVTEMEWLTEYEFEEDMDYAISYKVKVYPALGGALNTSDNTYYYEGGILDQAFELEESTSEVVTQLTPEPLVLHFWGGDSPNVGYETVAFTWDTPFGVEKYLIYYGADYETSTVVEVEKGSDKLVDAHGVTASDPVGEYAKVWSADKAYIINDMKTSPAYVRVEAIDSYDRVIAMGQYYTYNFTVRPEQEDIQDHQPKFSIEYQTEGEHQYQWAVTAKHISAARAYAKIFSWKVKNGADVVAEGTCQPDAVSIGYKTMPQLREYSWYFDEGKFEPETKYTFEYEITYVPVTNSYEVGEKTPLDYNPETKEFTPAANPDKPTGIAHDPRVLRPLALDGEGHVKYRTKVGDDDKVYTYYDEECRYITLSHCNYDHSRKEIIIKSSDIAAANSDFNFEVTSSEKPDNIALDLNLKAEIDEGTERKSTEKGHRGLRSVNGLYESVRLSWNHPISAGIDEIVINDGSKDDGATEKIALSYGDKIKYIAKKNVGVSSALNQGISEMTGEYFSWLSHDDLYTPDKIKNQVSHITEENKDCIFMCGTSFVDKDTNPLQRKRWHKFKDGYITHKEMLYQLFSGCSISGCALLIPKKHFDKLGVFSEELKYMQDTEMWYRFLFGGVDFVCNTAEAGVLSRVHENQTTVTGKHLLMADYDIAETKIVKKLTEMDNEDSELLKNFMFSCCRRNSSKARKLAYYESKKKGILNVSDKFKYCYMTLYGKLRPLLVKIYYKMFFNIKIKNR